MPELAHVVIYAQILERSSLFYSEVVGLTLVGEIFNGRVEKLENACTSAPHENRSLTQIER